MKELNYVSTKDAPGVIGQQTLARDVRTAALPEGEFVVDSEIDEEPLKIAVTKL